LGLQWYREWIVKTVADDKEPDDLRFQANDTIIVDEEGT
jgi:hypothetical protein